MEANKIKNKLIQIINEAIKKIDLNEQINNEKNNDIIDNKPIESKIEKNISDLEIDDFYVFYVKDLKNDHNLLP